MTDTRIKKPASVVDASVAVKWFSREPGSTRARTVLKEGEMGQRKLLAPNLLFYEVGNALARGKKLKAKEIREALALLQNTSITFFSLDPVLTEYAAVFTEKYGITFYDAVYAACAVKENAVFLSANIKDHAKIREITVEKI